MWKRSYLQHAVEKTHGQRMLIVYLLNLFCNCITIHETFLKKKKKEKKKEKKNLKDATTLYRHLPQEKLRLYLWMQLYGTLLHCLLMHCSLISYLSM